MVNNFEFNTKSGSNSWALILGGSSGLGFASAQKLAKKGLNICIIHRTRRSKLKEFESICESLRSGGVEVAAFNKDAMSANTVAEMIQFFKDNNAEILVLLHSIAKGNLKPIYSEKAEEATLTGKDFLLTAEAMAVSLYDWASAFAKAKLFKENGRILTFTSEGSTKPLPNYAAVSAAKAALEAIVRSLAFELAPLKITANCIQAGVTDTESLQLIPGSAVLIEQALARNPQGRLTTPQDVANVVYLLSKPEASWINGAVIPVDGGEHLR
ncbi:NAD(P)-dependent dehydrogenase (short-subunit alcohol dehydrogenase family) [Leeuwenhoekiella aestuarii]|uniref:NAD(P)-dependent dehydrogenase (Short-subunit alcohol dehydrogenase family) n=1 Tax=Leeuwenhoekiella aestuarii TaxID=2249426 RepID=A0A4Q0NRZ2_9FLAO|nr:SDR family oxidoreductase [Leeuwenhoekiella aestuarii]RXG13416.1 NAD(P)-dependent dehydrogenase (short-subunit alcohol dehydrogenase family) [Leeuwenhoekiella aestuarii]RXG14853.1 NAD(P)-dependent dehydrogenase (short-subunit alcohol dehydrogenase family) [Leeuwenhoekiella aestuarii]